jgi:hypothetical protein
MACRPASYRHRRVEDHQPHGGGSDEKHHRDRLAQHGDGDQGNFDVIGPSWRRIGSIGPSVRQAKGLASSDAVNRRPNARGANPRSGWRKCAGIARSAAACRDRRSGRRRAGCDGVRSGGGHRSGAAHACDSPARVVVRSSWLAARVIAHPPTTQPSRAGCRLRRFVDAVAVAPVDADELGHHGLQLVDALMGGDSSVRKISVPSGSSRNWMAGGGIGMAALR